MAKYLSVYMNDADLENLNSLQKVLDVREESRIVKMALKHLGNDHLHGEPAPEMINNVLTVEIPKDVRLRAMVRQCREELKREFEQKRAVAKMREDEKKKNEEMAKAIGEMFGG